MTLHHVYPAWPVALVCRVLAVPRSSFYYRQQRAAETAQAALEGAIEAVLLDHPRFGYRRVKQELARRGVQVGYEQVRRTISHGHCPWCA